MSQDFDFSEVVKLQQDLAEIPAKVIPNVRKAIEVTARNIKDDWKKNVPKISSRGSRIYKTSIDYEMQLGITGSIGADIGPNIDRPGGSFGLLEDAPGGVTSAPQYSGRKAVKQNEKDFLDGLDKALKDAENL